jgi:hypothetical protein
MSSIIQRVEVDEITFDYSGLPETFVRFRFYAKSASINDNISLTGLSLVFDDNNLYQLYNIMDTDTILIQNQEHDSGVTSEVIDSLISYENYDTEDQINPEDNADPLTDYWSFTNGESVRLRLDGNLTLTNDEVYLMQLVAQKSDIDDFGLNQEASYQLILNQVRLDIVNFNNTENSGEYSYTTSHISQPSTQGCTIEYASNYDANATEDDGSCTFVEIISGVPLITDADKEIVRNKINSIIDYVTGTEIEKDNKIDYLVESNELGILLTTVPEVEAVLNVLPDDDVTKKNKISEILKIKQRVKDSSNKLKSYFTQKKIVQDSVNLNNVALKDATINDIKSVLASDQLNTKLIVDPETKTELLSAYNLSEEKTVGKELKMQIVTDESIDVILSNNEIVAIEVPLDVQLGVTYGENNITVNTTVSASSQEKVLVYNGNEYNVGDLIQMPNGGLLIVEGIGSVVLADGMTLAERDASYSDFLVFNQVVTNEDVNITNYDILKDVSQSYLYDGENLTVSLVSNTTNTIVNASISNNLLNVTLNTDSNGSDTITILLESTIGGGSIEKTISLLVNAVNDPPTLTSLSNLSMTEGEVFEILNVVNDLEGGYSVVVSHTGEVLESLIYDSINNKIVVTAKSSYSTNITTTVTVTVTDGEYNVTESFLITIASGNDPHTLLLLSGKNTVTEGNKLNIRYLLTDNDLLYSSQTYTLKVIKDGVVISTETISDETGDKYLTGSVELIIPVIESDRTELYTLRVTDETGVTEVESSRSITILRVRGCTEVLAVNYNPLALVDDGSCFIEQYNNNTLSIKVSRR